MNDPVPEENNVVELGSQMRFEGIPVVGITDTLRSMKSKPTDKVRHHFDNVTGWFNGRVIEVRTPESGEGSVNRIHIIEVLDWGTKE